MCLWNSMPQLQQILKRLFFRKGLSQGHKVNHLESFEKALLVEYACQIWSLSCGTKVIMKVTVDDRQTDWINIVAAFQGMHVLPAKHSYAWLPRKCDYRTDRHRDGRTDTEHKLIPMCHYASQATQKQYTLNHLMRGIQNFHTRGIQYFLSLMVFSGLMYNTWQFNSAKTIFAFSCPPQLRRRAKLFMSCCRP